MPIPQHQHQRTSSGSALLDDVFSCYRKKFRPVARTGGKTVDFSDPCSFWSQRGKINSNSTAARHNFDHLFKSFQNSVAGIGRTRDNEAVIEGHLISGSGSCQNPAAWDIFKIL